MRTRRQGIVFDARKMFTLSKFMKYGFFALLAIIILIPIMFFWYSRDLPTPGKLVSSPTAG